MVGSRGSVAKSPKRFKVDEQLNLRMCEEIKSLEEIDNLAVKQCGKVQLKKGMEEVKVIYS